MVTVIDGFDNVDDNISSGSIPSSDTLVSSTYGGNDSVTVFSPMYEIYLGEGNDTLSGGKGGEAYGGGGDDSFSCTPNVDLHRLYGGDNNDFFTTFTTFPVAGAVEAYGGTGRDVFHDFSPTRGSRAWNGGSDFDVVSFGGSTGLAVTLGGSGGPSGSLNATFNGIEGVSGTSGADTVTGAAVDNMIIGGGGGDILTGGGGDDFLIGEARNLDFVRAYLGIKADFATVNALDPLNCNASSPDWTSDSGGVDDTLFGGAGSDVLSGGSGADSLNGGNGNDWATYRSADGGVVLGLRTGGTGGHATGDSFVSIENVQGSLFDDRIEGTSGDNHLTGLGGQDALSGLAGNDTLDGGTGRDTLTGGRDDDTLTGGDTEDCFVFSGELAGLGFDSITDFQVNFDEIWLSAGTFRRAGGPGVLAAEAFVLGSVAGERDDRFLYDATTGVLSYDADGNRAGAAVAIAGFVPGLALTADDLVIVA